MKRQCRACNGTGEDVCLACYSRPRYAMTDYACQDPAHRPETFCPVCHGSREVEERIPAADAIADAETLLQIADDLRAVIWFGQRSLWRASQHGDFAGLNARASRHRKSGAWSHGVAHKSARAAADAAFRAIPALRG